MSAERKIAIMIHELENAIDDYILKKGKEEEVRVKISALKNGIASVVSRYCEDFSGLEYFEELKKCDDEREQ